MKEYVLGIDTGKHFAAALMSHEDGRKTNLEGMYYQHETCFMSEDVTDLCRSLADLIARKDVSPDQLTICIELPSHRYFGRGNSSALLKAFWQGLRIIMNFAGQCARIIPIPADEWNEQRTDKQKKMIFKDQFPDFKDLPYYQEKHGSRSNNHERDAALFTAWVIKRIRLDIPFEFS